MEVVLLKDWAGHKKSAQLTITDPDVYKKGLEIGLFEKPKEKASKPKKED